MPLRVIRASAGSGKTYALAMFFLRILLRPAREGHAQNPAAILATTFTRAAAGEILDRIVRQLAAAVLSDDERAKVSEHIGSPVSREECSRALRTLGLSLDRLGVSTMDAFFQQTAKAFAAEMGLAPDWQPAVDESADELNRATLRALLTRAEPESLANALWTYKQNTGSSIHNALTELSKTLDELTVPAGDTAGFARPARRKWTPADLDAAREFLTDSAGWIPKTAKGKPDGRWEKAVDKLRAELEPGGDVTAVLENGFALKILERSDYFRVAIPPALCDALAPVLRIAISALKEQHQARLRALAWLAHHYRVARDEAVFQSAAYTFDDVSRILAAHTIRSDDLYFRLGTKFEHVLFDEFQDTSRRQFNFFRPLVEEIGASGGYALVVGDEKQAIYGWRGGDRELMRKPLEEIGALIDNDPAPQLHRSFRSSPAILNAVNRTFKTLLGDWLPDSDDADAIHAAGCEWMEGFADHEAAECVANLEGCVQMHEVPAPDPEEDGDGPFIGHALGILGAHLAADPGRKVAILLRKNKLMPRIIAEIRGRFPDVDVSGEGGNPLTDSRAVELILSLLTWLDHPSHTAARYHVLTSPVREVFGVPASIPASGKPLPGESRHLRNLRRELMNRGFAAVIRAWVRAEEFRHHCTAHDHLRCEQLIEVARDFDRRGPARPSEFVAHIRTRRVERPGGSAIRVMSIHASKGLEFEAVILLDLDARKSHGGDAAAMQVDGAWHVVPPRKKAALLDLEHVRDAKVRRDFSEELSVLYVGMTRARSFLDIVLREDTTAPIGTLLRTALRPEPGSVAEQHGGLSARDCDAASGRGRSDLRPPDPGIAGQEIAIVPLAGPAPGGLRPAHATPSGREDEGTVLVSRILKPSNRSAMRRGELIHAWLSQIAWIEHGLPSPASLLSTTGPLWAHLAKADATALAAGILAQINDAATDLHRALSRTLFAATTDIELWTERRFAVIDDGGGLLTGCFDRVVIWRDPAGKALRAHILDFKTDGFRDAAERRLVEDRYRPQLAAYTEALRKLLPAAEIESSLCFIAL